jgi:outer membrane protein assembly factor BamB
MRRTMIVSCFAAALSAAPLLAADWPQFRGPDGNGLVSQANLPMAWSADKNVLWKVPLPGTGWSQPIVWGDRIFLTAAETENQKKPKGGENDPGLGILLGSPPPTVVYRYRVLCLDGRTGKVLWQTLAHEGKPRIATHRNNTYASETPVTDGDRIIACFGMIGVFAFDTSGKPLWNKDLGAFPMQFGWGTGSSPALHDGRVFFQCDNEKSSFLVALDAKTGDEIWRVPRDEKSNWCTPYLWHNAKRTELVCAGGVKYRSYDPADGKLLWELKADGRTAVTPVGDDSLLFLDSEHRVTGVRGSIVAVRPGASGDITPPSKEALGEFVAWTMDLELPRTASPLLMNDCLVIFAQQGGLVNCYDAKTGKELYSKRLPQAGGFTASPIAASGRIYAIDERGLSFILKPGPDFELIASNPLDGETFWASPAPLADSLLLRGTDNLYCITK